MSKKSERPSRSPDEEQKRDQNVDSPDSHRGKPMGAIEKIITPVQKIEQKTAAIKEAKKNHFISMSVMGMLHQPSTRF